MTSLILLGLISLTFATYYIELYKRCICSDQHMAADCTESCFWENNSCRDKTCADYTQTECSYHETCKWGTSCKDYTPVCSDYKTEQDCDYLSTKYNCAWKDAACKPFTKCSDYIPGKTGCSSKSGLTQRCRTNTAQTACEDYTITTCASFTTSDSCYYSDAGYCIWDTTCKDLLSCAQIIQQSQCQYRRVDGKSCIWDTTCKDLLSCAQIKQQSQCQYKWVDGKSCIWDTTCKSFFFCSQIQEQAACLFCYSYCTYTTTCKDKTCADYYTADRCTYVNQPYSIIGTLCKWDTTISKCVDAVDTSALTATTCKRNTQYTFTWDGTKCNQCTGNYYYYDQFDFIRNALNFSLVLIMMVSLWMIQF